MQNKNDLGHGLLTPFSIESDAPDDISEVGIDPNDTTVKHDLNEEQLPEFLKYYTTEIKSWNRANKNPDEEYSISDVTEGGTFSIKKGTKKILEITEKSCIFTNPIDTKVLDVFAAKNVGVGFKVEMCGSATEARALITAMEGKHTLKFSVAAIKQMEKTATSAEDKYLIAKLARYEPAPVEQETKTQIKPN